MADGFWGKVVWAIFVSAFSLFATAVITGMFVSIL